MPAWDGLRGHRRGARALGLATRAKREPARAEREAPSLGERWNPRHAPGGGAGRGRIRRDRASVAARARLVTPDGLARLASGVQRRGSQLGDAARHALCRRAELGRARQGSSALRGEIKSTLCNLMGKVGAAFLRICGGPGRPGWALAWGRPFFEAPRPATG